MVQLWLSLRVSMANMAKMVMNGGMKPPGWPGAGVSAAQAALGGLLANPAALFAGIRKRRSGKLPNPDHALLSLSVAFNHFGIHDTTGEPIGHVRHVNPYLLPDAESFAGLIKELIHFQNRRRGRTKGAEGLPSGSHSVTHTVTPATVAAGHFATCNTCRNAFYRVQEWC